MLGVTFQFDTRFNIHVKNKLTKANKSLHVLRALRREGYNQKEIVYLSILLHYLTCHMGLRCIERLKLTQQRSSVFWIDIRNVGTSRTALIYTIF